MTEVVNDELRTAVDEIFGTDPEQWTLIGLFDAITKVVARTNNRVFVGLPLCMHPLIDCLYSNIYFLGFSKTDIFP